MQATLIAVRYAALSHSITVAQRVTSRIVMDLTTPRPSGDPTFTNAILKRPTQT
jgi:hypothetical protein